MTARPESDPVGHPFPESWEAWRKPHVDLDAGGEAQRSDVSPDERLRSAICQRLRDHPHIDPSTLAVSVEDGEVTLSGAVADAEAARIAVELTRSTDGVHAVHDQIDIQG